MRAGRDGDISLIFRAGRQILGFGVGFLMRPRWYHGGRINLFSLMLKVCKGAKKNLLIMVWRRAKSSTHNTNYGVARAILY